MALVPRKQAQSQQIRNEVGGFFPILFGKRHVFRLQVVLLVVETTTSLLRRSITGLQFSKHQNLWEVIYYHNHITPKLRQS